MKNLYYHWVEVFINNRRFCDYITTANFNKLKNQVAENAIRLGEVPDDKDLLISFDGKFYQYTRKTPFYLSLLSCSLERTNQKLDRILRRRRKRLSWIQLFS